MEFFFTGATLSKLVVLFCSLFSPSIIIIIIIIWGIFAGECSTLQSQGPFSASPMAFEEPFSMRLAYCGQGSVWHQSGARNNGRK